jgi:hypothetical protein
MVVMNVIWRYRAEGIRVPPLDDVVNIIESTYFPE